MRILVIGANGFIGANIASFFSKSHLVYRSSRNPSKNKNRLFIDLLQKASIEKALQKATPEVVIHCAGVIDNGPRARLNVDFTRNLLESVKSLGINPKIIICGSASVYGIVKKEDLPISENHQLNPVGDYANAKKEEEEFALKFASENQLNVVVMRIFNPVGKGMQPRFLIPNLISQLDDVKKTQTSSITVRRKDSLRDYLDVRDVTLAAKCICENPTAYNVYNIGSGISTSNEELIKSILKISNIGEIDIVQSEPKPELIFAAQADIARIKGDLAWQPSYSLEEALKEIVSGYKQ